MNRTDTYESPCVLCPRNCRVDRNAGEKGFCGQNDLLRAARAALHFWEEPCISGKSGSGAVFFSGCALHCVFCQNEKIANGTVGKVISEERLEEIFFSLQEQGAANINLVTAGHFAPQVAEVLRAAKRDGLKIPFVYNTGSYETVETIRLFEGLVDIYLPDFKYCSTDLSRKYSHAPDYFKIASEAVAEMVRQTGTPVFFEKKTGKHMDAEEYNERSMEDGPEILMERGTIVRHLLLPGCTGDSKKVLEYLYRTYGDRIFISIMNQFTPLENVKGFPELKRKVTEKEYDEVVDYAIELGIENAFIQEGDVAEESFIPEFDLEGT